ncbi:MAG: hypothetical protein U0168_30210 [Nannocystaceae bacterium]
MITRRVALATALALGCSSRPEAPADGAPASMAATPAAAPSKPAVAAPESVVFADRTSLAYVLLVDGKQPAPTRTELAALVERELAGDRDDPEVGVLLEFIALDPTVDPRLSAGTHPRDLIGLHIEALDATTRRAAVSESALADPVLTRELDPPERAQLASLRAGVLLRADYRNERAVRGLRLLQTLVRLLAAQQHALIHDPDTGETMGVTAFERRRLQAGWATSRTRSRWCRSPIVATARRTCA